jgi:hypothetical protein
MTNNAADLSNCFHLRLLIYLAFVLGRHILSLGERSNQTAPLGIAFECQTCGNAHIEFGCQLNLFDHFRLERLSPERACFVRG